MVGVWRPSAGTYELCPFIHVGRQNRSTYDFVCVLRAMTPVDSMTVDFFLFDMGFLARAATLIINEVRGINRIVYDPPGDRLWFRELLHAEGDEPSVS